jgi:hypothetical protein
MAKERSRKRRRKKTRKGFFFRLCRSTISLRVSIRSKRARRNGTAAVATSAVSERRRTTHQKDSLKLSYSVLLK